MKSQWTEKLPGNCPVCGTSTPKHDDDCGWHALHNSADGKADATYADEHWLDDWMPKAGDKVACFGISYDVVYGVVSREFRGIFPEDSVVDVEMCDGSGVHLFNKRSVRPAWRGEMHHFGPAPDASAVHFTIDSHLHLILGEAQRDRVIHPAESVKGGAVKIVNRGDSSIRVERELGNPIDIPSGCEYNSEGDRDIYGRNEGWNGFMVIPKDAMVDIFVKPPEKKTVDEAGNTADYIKARGDAAVAKVNELKLEELKPNPGDTRECPGCGVGQVQDSLGAWVPLGLHKSGCPWIKACRESKDTRPSESSKYADQNWRALIQKSTPVVAGAAAQSGEKIADGAAVTRVDDKPRPASPPAILPTWSDGDCKAYLDDLRKYTPFALDGVTHGDGERKGCEIASARLMATYGTTDPRKVYGIIRQRQGQARWDEAMRNVRLAMACVPGGRVQNLGDDIRKTGPL